MRKTDLRLKATVLAFLLVLMQASVTAHAVDHNFTEHQEWCQLLGNSDLSVALHEVGRVSVAPIDHAVSWSPTQHFIFASAARHYASRAPPL